MTYHFVPAKLEGVGLFIAIAGSSRTGKTYTALRLAKGIAGAGGKIAAIDTEGKRMSHYAKEFDFDVFNMSPPFNGRRFLEAAQGAQEAGYACLLIDSFSLEWSGSGGVLWQREDQWKKLDYNAKASDRIWNRVKGPGSDHKDMMDGFLQLTMPVIFCLRANEVGDHLGGGWKIDQDKRFLYEWTVGLTLHPDTPGEPRFDMVDAKKKPLWKVQDQHRHLFLPGQKIGEATGAALQEWRNSHDARQMGSASTGAPRRTLADWFDDIEAALDDASTEEGVQAIVARDDVHKALTGGNINPEHVVRLNALIKKALDRTADQENAPWVTNPAPADEGAPA